MLSYVDPVKNGRKEEVCSMWNAVLSYDCVADSDIQKTSFVNFCPIYCNSDLTPVDVLITKIIISMFQNQISHLT